MMMEHLECSYDLRAGLVEELGHDVVRVEERGDRADELSELSEPGGGAGAPVVWRTLCDIECRALWVC